MKANRKNQSSTSSNQEKEALRLQKQMNQAFAFRELLTIREAKDGVLDTHDVGKIAKKYEKLGVDRQNLYYNLRRYLAGTYKDSISSIPLPAVESPPSVVDASSTSSTSTLTEGDNVVVIPQPTEIGSKKNKKAEREANEKLIRYLTTLAAEDFKKKRDEAKAEGTYVAKGTLQDIVRHHEVQNKLPLGSLHSETIRKRVYSGNLSGIRLSSAPPLADIEEFIVSIAIMCSRIGTPFNKNLLIGFTTSIINNTYHAEQLIQCKRQRLCFPESDDITALHAPGERWFRGFMKRHSDRIKMEKLLVTDCKRVSYVTKEFFKDMYDKIYPEMVKAGVAIELDQPAMFDKEGNEVTDKSKMFGFPTKYKMVRPQNCIFVDETGCNTNMKTDGKVGGEAFITPCDKSGKGLIGNTSDIHFSVLGFISAAGEPVMCAVILKSTKDARELNLTHWTGIDRMSTFKDYESIVEAYEAESGENGAMQGGPTCVYNGKEVPCFVGTSPNASITTKLLTDMLRMMDELELFDRSGDNTPFLLLDGHHSRLGLEFLEYIHSAEHYWRVCIGVPYATHVWQPNDSSQLNGAFKNALAKLKRALFYKFSDKPFGPEQIMPLVRKSWNESFAKPQNIKKSIAERGWGPLNYVLLKDKAFDNIDKPSVPEENVLETDKPTVINVEGTSEYFIFKLLKKMMQNEGIMREYRSHEEEVQQQQTLFEKLKKEVKMTSGSLTRNGVFCLNTPGVLLCMREKVDEAAQKQAEVNTKKAAQDIKRKEQLRLAIQACVQSKTLKAPELRTLIKHFRKDTDPPMEKKRDALEIQWRSMEHRLMDVLDVYGAAPANEAVDHVVGEAIDHDENAAADNDGDEDEVNSESI